MNIQSQAVSAALALFPVYPPQWVTPVQPPSIAHGGIPLSAFTPQGLEVVIEPVTGLLNWVVAAFDVVTLFVNGVRTNVNKTIMPGEEGNRFLLYLPELWFTNGVNDVFYRVTRVSGNTDDSPTLQLLYHNPAPTLTVSHPPSIGPGQPAVITITVGYARPYDTVTLTIGTWSITFNNPDPTKPITHTLTAAELQQIKDGTHPVSARVIDQLNNSNVSATTSIKVNATPLSIDTSVLLLDGLAIVPSGHISAPNGVDAIGNTALRLATNGSPPYGYKSSSLVAEVDSAGKVTGRRNGTGTITVTDSSGAQVSYRVAVANVYLATMYHQGHPWTYGRYTTSLTNLGYVGLTPGLRAVLQRCYLSPWFPSDIGHFNIWTGGGVGEGCTIGTSNFFTVDVNTDMWAGLAFRLYNLPAEGMLTSSHASDESVITVLPNEE